MQSHDNGLIRKLANSSLRLNAMLLGVVALTLLLVGVSYWALSRVVEQERDKFYFHFGRLVGDIREHEAFLLRIAQQSNDSAQAPSREVITVQSKLIDRGPEREVYEGREFSFAMPFTLVRPAIPMSAATQETFSFGVKLANFYSSFWSMSAYPSPQIFLLDVEGTTSIAVPSLGTLADGTSLTPQTYWPFMARIRALLTTSPEQQLDRPVQWVSFDHNADQSGHELMGYISTDLPAGLLRQGKPNIKPVAVTLLDIQLINDFERILDRPLYDQLELIAPDGTVLTNAIDEVGGYHDGLNLFGNGIVFKVGGDGYDGWSGLYLLSYQSFFRYVKWQLLGVVGLILGSLAGGWVAIRWYAMRVVAPARLAHQKIVESDEFSRAVIQTAPVALCVLRPETREVVMQNHLADAWLGSAEAISQLSRDWSLDEGDKCLGGESVLDLSGRILHASFTQAPYRGESAVLCAFNDITAHKQAQQILAEAKLSADAASEAKSVFLATMSHEIRTPLYGVLGTLELLGLTELSPQQRDYLDTVQRSSAVLLQLISDILDVSKIEAGQMAIEDVELNPLELAEEVVSGYAALAHSKQLKLYACIDSDVPGTVRGDAVRIRQILNNLVSNALKFTDVGRVVLRLKFVPDEAPGSGTLQWQVTDTGIGVSQEQQLRLFEPFYQAHGQEHTVSGTGLGLSICWRLSELMGGSLRVVSEIGLGSSFTFSLPLPVVTRSQPLRERFTLAATDIYIRSPVKELAQNLQNWIERWGGTALLLDTSSGHVPADGVLLDLLSGDEFDPQWRCSRVSALPESGVQPQISAQGWTVSLYRLAGIAQALQLAQQGESGGKAPALDQERLGKLGLRVLVAEDNPINQVLLREQLEELGCQVTLAGNGRDAMQSWRPGLFDVLITDVNMPLMNGYELAQGLRRVDSNIPIIGVTANALKEEGERCIAVGMNAWLVKPINLRTLYDNLLKACAGIVIQPLLLEQLEPHKEEGDVIQVSEKMRDLFVRTMREDIQEVWQALQCNDMSTARQQVHRLRGALAVVQAHALSDACGEVEDALVEQSGSELHAAVGALMNRVESALERLC
ncbi:hybrid sensor histidine kinase/response regulator [Pseudomonas sp. 8O]|uniref:hybrid sensor histidine kinase/response regulator n=1 Tax=Pseudomonas sp. 8O TaxID=2653165 RepID=UPI0012EF60C1|nr:hybrid sensor histidine kinase/response regulator [Pseudomonas sp. 8O]VXC35688.1 Two-component system, NarL family, capsular synthesis sensor histidine kinase RcsC [Pseudomonas sp. 8O]